MEGRREERREERRERTTENEISKVIVEVSIEIHRRLGPGLFESVYEDIVGYELGLRGIPFERQVTIPLLWKDMLIGRGFRADMIIDRQVLVEFKSVEYLLPVHKKQVLTYLKITGLRLGLLLNFRTELMKDGIFRLVNSLEAE